VHVQYACMGECTDIKMVFSYINYHQKNEVYITLHFQPCSTYFTAVQIEKHLSNQTALKIFITKGSFYIHHFSLPMGTKEDTGKSMKNVWYAKRHLSLRKKNSV